MARPLVSSSTNQRCEATPSPLNKYIPASVDSGDGIRVYYHFCPALTLDTYGVRVLSQEYMTLKLSEEEKEERFNVMESETITVLKLIQRLGGNIEIPVFTRVAYGETIFNFPVFCCKDTDSATLVQTAMMLLCNAWHTNGDDRLISYSIAINVAENQAFQISFAGHVDDFAYVFDELGVSFPKPEDTLPWIEKLYQINNSFGTASAVPPVFSLVTRSRELQFGKVFVPQEYIDKYLVEDGHLNLVMQIPEDEAKQLLEYQMHVAPVYIIKSSKCHKCGKEYCECQCIKFVDETYEEITDAQPIGLVWTNRPIC